MSEREQQDAYSSRSAGVRRLMKEAKELRDPTEMYHAQPLEDNLFEWHFTVRGPADSDFEGGIYHGRMIFPAEYPMKPPNIILLTPNGRFELNKKVCLSISGYHPETWLPSWSNANVVERILVTMKELPSCHVQSQIHLRTALLAIIGFMPTSGQGAIGSADYPSKERKKLALQSKKWKCNECAVVMDQVLKPLGEDGKNAENEARSLIHSSGDGPAPSSDSSPIHLSPSTPILTPPTVSTPELCNPSPPITESVSVRPSAPLQDSVNVSRRAPPSSSGQTDTFIWTMLVILSGIVFALACRRIFLLD